jgi:UDP-sugar pyrophosphorylase
LDHSYPGGLAAYLTKAQALLQESAQGVNPFAEYTAAVPNGESLSFDNSNLSDAEHVGLEAASNLAICIVAGGLGERLGYSGIKLSLETNLCTNQSYLQTYCDYIQALEYRTQSKIPLVIMTSGDTDQATRELLQQNNNFGLRDVTIVMQDKVAALKDGAAGLAMDGPWAVQTKPHGHGDVHHLLYRHGSVDKWVNEGKTHLVFLQDTNALVVNGILPTLGVSVSKGFHMNSICIPRRAGEAAGAITKLE